MLEALFAEFDWEADSLLDAVLTAIVDAESVEGITVLHVDPDDLVRAPGEAWVERFEGRPADAERPAFLGAINVRCRPGSQDE